jgi:hypothetical protein
VPDESDEEYDPEEYAMLEAILRSIETMDFNEEITALDFIADELSLRKLSDERCPGDYPDALDACWLNFRSAFLLGYRLAQYQAGPRDQPDEPM